MKTGLSGFRLLLDKAGPMLPFGADGVVAGLSSLLGMVETAMANKENLEALRDRSFDLLQV